MIPDFLEKFRQQIEEYRLDTVRILANPIKDGQNLSIKQSKFLGQPYVPKSQTYPTCQDGTPMLMLAQINFSEVPELENYPTSGILQLFVHPTDWYNMERSDYKIIFHQSDTEDYHTDFGFITEKLFEESPIYCEHSLIFQKETEFGGREDFRFQIDFGGLDYFDFQETLPKEHQEQMDNLFYIIGHKIGGYAYFTQSDPRDYDDKTKNDVLLLQIDTDEEIMFGDSGVANIFINISDLKERNFDKAYFNWDCC
ncbi:MAG: DUF1963 domain-containing protein [Candidatus Kapaibacterium sp.]